MIVNFLIAVGKSRHATHDTKHVVVKRINVEVGISG